MTIERHFLLTIRRKYQKLLFTQDIGYKDKFIVTSIFKQNVYL